MILKLKFVKDWRALDLTLNYKKSSLRELVSFVAKGIPPKYTKEKSDNIVTVLNQRTNRNFLIDYTFARLNDLKKKSIPENKMLCDNDILINSTGVGTAGRIAQLFKVPEPTTVDGHMIIIRANKNIIDPVYLGYALKAQQTIIENLQEGSTGQTELNRQRLLDEVFVSYPKSIKKQKEIGKILYLLDKKMEINKKINAHLEQIATMIFNLLFPNIMSGESTIGDYISPKRGKSLLSKDAVSGIFPVVAGGLQPATYHNQANTKAPVITISASGANAGFVNLWHVPVWSSDSSFIDSSITNYVYFWYIMLKNRQKEIYDAQTGSAQPHIYPKHIAAMKTIKLDDNIIKVFMHQVTPLFEFIDNNLKINENLETLRDSLLPKLMSGEISVTV